MNINYNFPYLATTAAYPNFNPATVSYNNYGQLVTIQNQYKSDTGGQIGPPDHSWHRQYQRQRRHCRLSGKHRLAGLLSLDWHVPAVGR